MKLEEICETNNVTLYRQALRPHVTLLLACDYVVSRLLSTFILYLNKSYKNAVFQEYQLTN